MFNPFDPFGNSGEASFQYGTGFGSDSTVTERFVRSVQAMQIAIASSGSETANHHIERMVKDRNNLLFLLHFKYGVEVVELAQLVGIPWTAIYDIVDEARAEKVRAHELEEAKKAEEQAKKLHGGFRYGAPTIGVSDTQFHTTGAQNQAYQGLNEFLQSMGMYKIKGLDDVENPTPRTEIRAIHDEATEDATEIVTNSNISGYIDDEED